MADRSTLQRAAARNTTAAILQVKGLNVYYGHSHALQGVDLTLDHGVLSVVGRNGMGKTTLCKAIMGLVRASSGSIRLFGEELTGRRPADIARLGIGYVPQGRRLWPSLTVDEHLRLVQGSQHSGWTIERIYDAFPQLAGRKSHRGWPIVGRRAADAGDLARVAAQSAPAGHGRADRGPGAGDRRPASRTC